MTDKAPTIAADTEKLLHLAFVKCRQKRHLYITVEHLLHALVDDDSLRPVWARLQVKTDTLSRDVANFLDDNTPQAPGEEEVDTQPTLGFQRVIQRAIMRGQEKSRHSVSPIDLLLAIFGEKDSHAVYYLGRSNVTRETVEAIISGKKIASPTPTKDFFAGNEQALTKRIRLAEKALLIQKGEQAPQGQVFISYSHADTDCLQRLLVHLKPLEKAKAINCWSDQQIRVGDKWRSEIQKNLDHAVIAILLLSADFLASDFIVNNELPPLLMAADTKGIRILPVMLKPCGFLRDPVLSIFQAVNDPKNPLMGMTHIQQEEIYDKIASEVSTEMQRRTMQNH